MPRFSPGPQPLMRSLAASRVRPQIDTLERRVLLSVSFGSTASTTDSNLVALPGAVQSADIDGDGKTDLVVGVNTSGSTLSLTGTDILLSNGDGTFTIQAGPDFPAGSSTSTNAFAVGALAPGGRPDLVYASQQNNADLTAEITPEINTSAAGSASFTAAAPTTIASPSSFNPQQVIIGDFSGDGVPDVAVLGLSAAGESLVILSGNGSGGFAESFSTTITINPGEQLNGAQMLAGDFNGDGKLDLAIYDPAVGDVAILINTSTAGAVSFSQTPTPITLALSGYDSGPVAAGDFNGDGQTDLVVGENPVNGGDPGIAVFLASGTTSATLALTAQPAVPALPVGTTAALPVGALAVADFNGDGKLDVAEDDGVLLGDGTGNLSSPTSAVTAPAASDAEGYNAVVAGDFDGSGLLGVAAVDQVSHTILAANQTTPTPPPTPAVAPSTTALASGENPAEVGDAITFTATVSATDGAPTGYVTFFSGSTELQSVALVAGSAQFVDSSLQIGTTTVTARYLGDSSFAASTSAPLTETVLATLPSDSSLTPAFAAPLPASLIAGARVNLQVPIAVVNGAAVASSGRTTLTLYANTVPALQGSQVVLATDTIKNLPIRAGKAVVLRLRVLSLPATLADGDYYLIATVTDSTGATTGTASTGTIDVAAPFSSIATSLASLLLPPTIVGGVRTAAFAVLRLTNTGNENYVGPLTLSLYASADPAPPSGAIPFHALVVKRIVLRPSIGATVRLPLETDPTVAAAGAYYIIAQSTDAAGNVSSAPSAQTVQIVPAVYALSVASFAVSIVPGPRGLGTATAVITNTGNVPASGIFECEVTAEPSGSGTPTTYGISRASLSLAAGKSRRFAIRLTGVSSLLAGDELVLDVFGPGGASASATAAVPQ